MNKKFCTPFLVVFLSACATTKGTDRHVAGKSYGGSVIHCWNKEKTVNMEINPDDFTLGWIAIDGQRVKIVKETKAPDGKLSYDMDDGSKLSLYVLYDEQDTSATLSKSGTDRTITCNSKRFVGNGW